MTPRLGRPPPGGPAGDRPRHPPRPLPGRPRAGRREGRGVAVELGPEDLRDLPRHFGQADARLEGYGAFDIEILAEINHAPRLDPRRASLDEADRFVARGGRPDRPGLRPRRPVGRGRRRGRGPARRGHPRLDRQLRPGRGRRGRRRRGRPGAERQRDQPRPGRRLGRRGRRHPRRAGTPRRAGRDGRVPGPPGRPLPDRPDPRADRLRVRGLAGPLPRGPPALSRRRDDDGRRQPDRADRRRFRGRQHAADRVLPGARPSAAS